MLGRKQPVKGFTVIELLIVVVLVGILMAIALPAYDEQQRKARRAEAQAALTGLSIALQRYYTEQSPSTYVGATLGGSGIYPNEAPIDGGRKYYDLSAAVTSTSFTISAAPKNSQSGDNCGTLTLTNIGFRDITGAATGTTTDDCWR
ncbi:MAG: type IV pilin protein [Pseudomonadota bacterium]